MEGCKFFAFILKNGGKFTANSRQNKEKKRKVKQEALP
jgi:hypothetical protein